MSKAKILVVDDEDIVLLSCHRALTPEGYEVRTVKSGLDALKMLEKEGFDIILTDLKMPDMDGIEVLKRIKEGWTETKVIIITGYGTSVNTENAIRLGAFDCIEKPFTPEQILSVIEKALA